MKRQLVAISKGMRRVARPALVAGLVLGAAILGTQRARADTGNVAVTATSAAKFTFTVSVTTLGYGTGLDPAGSAASGSNVASFVDPADSGAYYVTNSTNTAYAVVVTIKSNKAYTGKVAATANGGSSGQTLAGLKWKLGDITDYSTANSATSFTAADDTTVFNAASTCVSGSALAKGNCVFNFDYALNVLWSQDPGTFSTTVTYTGTQS